MSGLKHRGFFLQRPDLPLLRLEGVAEVRSPEAFCKSCSIEGSSFEFGSFEISSYCINIVKVSLTEIGFAKNGST